MAVSELFKNGLASPWDVSPVGGNLLHVSLSLLSEIVVLADSNKYATDHWNPDMCKLLMEAGLDVSAEDDFKR